MWRGGPEHLVRTLAPNTDFVHVLRESLVPLYIFPPIGGKYHHLLNFSPIDHRQIMAINVNTNNN